MNSQRAAEEVICCFSLCGGSRSRFLSLFLGREVEFGRLVAYLGLDLFLWIGMILKKKSRDSYRGSSLLLAWANNNNDMG